MDLDVSFPMKKSKRLLRPCPDVTQGWGIHPMRRKGIVVVF